MLTVLIESSQKHDAALNATLDSLKRYPTLDIHTMLITKENKKELVSLLSSVSDDYVCFLKEGDTLTVNNPKNLSRVLSSHQYSIVGMRYLYREKPKPKYHPTGAVSLHEEPELVPLWLYNYIFRRDIFQNAASNSRFALLHEVYAHLMTQDTIYYLNDVSLLTSTIVEDSNTCPDAMKKNWYLDFVSYLLQPEIIRHKEMDTFLPDYLQYALCTLLYFRFRSNMNNGNKHVIDAEYADFEHTVKEFLFCIEDANFSDMMQPSPKLTFFSRTFYKLKRSGRHPHYVMPLHFFVSMMQLKYGDDYRLTYELPAETPDNIQVLAQGVFLQDISKLKCNLDLVDYDAKQQTLILEYHIDNFVDLSQFSLQVRLGGRELPVEETYRYAHTKYFGVSVQKASTFRTVISLKDDFTGKTMPVTFSLTRQGRTIILPLNAKTYLTRVCSTMNCSYWHFDRYMLTMNHNRTALVLGNAGIRPFFQEIGFVFSNLNCKLAILGFGLRTLYWLTHPFMKHKTIWLTYDKLYKGGDCGEYLYKYCCTREKETGITPAYVINGNCADYSRLQKEGYTPLKYKSVKHYMYYLNASVVFTTHGGVYNFNGLGKRSVPYVQNLLHHDVACIQHGLTVQQLAHNSNRLFNNMKRYYCASKYEIENLSRPIYGYEDKSILKLTGIPRYDGLVNQDKHQILITPTWRNYIAMPAAAKNEAKPYFAGFKKTDYFKIYNELLSDEKLIQTAKECGYTLIYLLHPVISAQIDDYPKHDTVKIIPSLTVNYEKILTESSLMVTDYSGVQFDFAYMRKPVVYYHPPKLPPHYKEGGFFYDTMGFGEICTGHNEIVDVLCDYMRNQCRMKPFYLAREDDFFAYNDLNSCQRIYDDMLEYQKSKA